MPYGFSKSIRNRYRKLWAKRQGGKGTGERLTNQRKPVPIPKKQKKKSKKCGKRKKR